MRVQFLLGRAGTGKTHACLEALRTALAEPHGPALILITPEQATFQMERALLTGGKGNVRRATYRAHVLSFQRLAARLMQEAGRPALPRLSQLGKRMLLRSLLEKEGGLSIFPRSSRSPGFVDQLAQTFTELRAYRLSPEQLQQEGLRTAKDNPILSAKLADLSRLYQAFQECLRGRFTDPDEALDFAADLALNSVFLRGARVWVDGFSGFTAQELRLLQAVWRRAEQVTIALCVDGREVTPYPRTPPAELDLFAPTKETLVRLLELAEEDGVEVAPPVVLDGPVAPRFAQAPALAHLESQLFRRPARPYTGSLGPGSGVVRIVAAANPMAEVAAAAREIVRLCRDEGYRFRDIAVILRDMDGYADLIRQVFADEGIPCFIDRKRGLAHHPAVELVRSAFEVYVRDWHPDAVFRCLRTDLFPASRSEVDRLENYVLEHGIRGKAWSSRDRWTYTRQYTLSAEDGEPRADDRQRLNELHEIRERVAAPLRRFCQALSAAENAGAMARAVWDLLQELRVSQTLASWAQQAEADGRLEEAREHTGAWEGIVQLLEDVCRTLGDEKLTPAAFLQVLEAGLESLRVALIPPGLDQVLVGSADRSRQPDIRAAFLLGASERSFPPPPEEDAVFSDEEREQMAPRVRLGPSSRTRLFHEQYLTYIAFTRASEYVWVSFPTADARGRALAPSPIIGRLRELFPALTVQWEPEEPAEDSALLARVRRGRELAAAVAHRLRRHREGDEAGGLWWSLYQWLAGDAELREQARPVFAALDYRNACKPLPRALAHRLYLEPSTRGSENRPPVFPVSASRLERYAACPFQHFAAHGLRLRERARFRLDVMQVGTFLHAALRDFVQTLAKEGRDWGTLSDEEAIALADACVDALIPRLHAEILLSSAKHRFLAEGLRRQVREAVLLLTEHARRSPFRPVAVELAFGPGESWPPLQLTLPDGIAVEVRGQIDRIDAARDEKGNCWLRIIDYKSRARTLSPEDVLHGLNLQLATYLAVVEEHGQRLGAGPLQPAGLLYFPLRRPLRLQTHPPEQAGAAGDRDRRMQGLFICHPDAVRLMDTALQAGGRSDLVAVILNKDGEVSGHTNAVSLARAGVLTRFTRRQIARLAGEIAQGRVAIEPYRKAGQRACSACPYHSVCRFDALVGGNGYRDLPRYKAKDAWALIEAEAGGQTGDPAEARPQGNPGLPEPEGRVAP